ncbi:MAG: hypothetical protein KDA71_20405 [Planctomycetales bacterium]|nr:hypothetical protein [Planctomycetales bacterium]
MAKRAIWLVVAIGLVINLAGNASEAFAQQNGWRPIVLGPPPTHGAVSSSPFANTPASYTQTLSPAPAPIVTPADIPPSLAPNSVVPERSIPMDPSSFVPMSSGCGCQPPGGANVYPPAYRPPTQLPGRYVAPPVTQYRPQTLTAPVIPPAGYSVGRGLLGRPTVYVDGQPVRNFLRWLSP